VLEVAKFRRIPLAEICSAEKPGPLWTYKDHWWAVTEDDCVLIYTHRGSNSPQCNVHRTVVERLMCGDRMGLRAQLLPWAYLKFDLRDYA
jgi:hypothetical protein